tara:strand:+ start:162 stop:824 length:663 start_codon:yes stop_codon:yes gene_type:complete
MKLHYWRSSPHSCKVLSVLDILGIKEDIDLIPTHPWEEQTTLNDVNPLGKIPTLVLENDVVLYDSTVICEYLSDYARFKLGTFNTLYPQESEKRWINLRQEVLAHGIMEASILRLLEERARPFHLQSRSWIHRQQLKIDRSLRHLEEETPVFEATCLTIGQVSLAIALSYIGYRFPSYIWHTDYPRLTRWYEQMMHLPVLSRNTPKEIHTLPEKMERIER